MSTSTSSAKKWTDEEKIILLLHVIYNKHNSDKSAPSVKGIDLEGRSQIANQRMLDGLRQKYIGVKDTSSAAKKDSGAEDGGVAPATPSKKRKITTNTPKTAKVKKAKKTDAKENGGEEETHDGGDDGTVV